MRLIDADEFERRIKRYDTTDYADKALYNFAHNEMITMPTACDIEQIRADIEAARYGLINDGLDVALRIINKHTKGE